MYVCIHIYVYMCMYIYIYIYVCVYIYIYIHIYTYIYCYTYMLISLFVCIATTIQAVLVAVYYIGMYICLYPQVEWLLPDRRLSVPESLDLVKASAHLITFTARYPGLVLEFSQPARDTFDSYTVMFNTRCSEYRRKSDADSAAEEGITRVLHLHVSTDHLSRPHTLRCPLLSLCMCCCILSPSLQFLHLSPSPQSHVTH